MQIFELHFNPKLREEQIFDSFVYEPENIYEKKLGSLHMVGELQNALPQNSKFLDNLVKVIKKNYYTLSLKSPEKALSQSLKKVNDFLAEEVKRDNVSWLGNLNFAVVSLNPSPLAKGDRVKDFTPHFQGKSGGFNLILTKTGDLKILLLRAGQINDIGKTLDLREIEPYPLKIFLNVVSGKLALNDKILVLTKEVFNFFQQQNLLTKIAQAESIDAKKIKEILPSSLFTKDEGSKVSGICFLSVVGPEVKSPRRPRAIFFQKEEKLSLSQAFSPFLKPIKTIHVILKKPFRFSKKIRERKKIFPKISIPKLPKIPRPKILIKKRLKRAIAILKIKFLSKLQTIKKKLILFLILVFFLLLGFLIFN